MNALLVSAITVGSPTQCPSLQDITIGVLREKGDPEDLLNLVMDGEYPLEVVTGLMEAVDYLTYHRILWARIESHDSIGKWFQSGNIMFTKIRHQAQQPIEYDLILAFGKDMRMALHSSQGAEKEIRYALEHFDYPSLFLLFAEHSEYAKSEVVAPEYENGLKSLLDEKVVDWLLGATDLFDVGVMNVLSNDLGLYRVSEGLSQLENFIKYWSASEHNYYADRRLAQLVPGKRPITFPSWRFVRGEYATYVDPRANTRQGARQLVLVLQASKRVEPPLEMLLRLRSNVLRWYMEGAFEPMRLKHELFVSKQYLTRNYLLQDLHFLGNLVLQKIRTCPIHEMENVLANPHTLSLLYEVLKGQCAPCQLEALLRLEFHHLYQLQHAPVPRDRALALEIGGLLRDSFVPWIRRGWDVFDGRSDLLFTPRGARYVAKRLLQYSIPLDKLCYMSLLLLRDIFAQRDGVAHYVHDISHLLVKKERNFYGSLREEAILDNRNAVAKLAYVLRLLPEAPYSIVGMMSWLKSFVARQRLNREHVRSINILFRRALQSMSSMKAFLSDALCQDDFFFLLSWFQKDAFREFRGTLRQINYNHVIVLQLVYHIAHHGPRYGGMELLYNEVSVYCHELLPEYVLPHLHYIGIPMEDKISTLQEMQYLSLLRLRQEPLSDELSQAIDNQLEEARTRWRHCFARHSGDVFSSREHTVELINALKAVPEADTLFSPLQLVQLFDSAKRFNIAHKADGQLDKHRELFLSDLHPSTRQWPISTLYRRYIWQNEDALDIDEIKLSVWFDEDVKVDKRIAVSNAISWPAVQAFKDKCLMSGARWSPPNGLQKRWIASRKKGLYKFLVEDRKNEGLPKDWFDAPSRVQRHQRFFRNWWLD